jgi:hypothetical protein
MTDALDERSVTVLMVGLRLNRTTGSGTTVSRQNKDRAMRLTRLA